MGAITTTIPLGDTHGRSLTRLFDSPPSQSPEVVEPEVLLMEAAQRGDKAAFSTIVQQHQGAVYGYFCARLIESTDAEDLCQEVFLRCYLGREKFQRAIAVRPWLLGIARNLIREHVRRKHRRREVAWTELCLEIETLGAGDDQHDEVLSHLPLCLESLGKSAREALQLRYHARMKLQEIGKKLCRSEGAVKLLMFRARQALKNCLDRKLTPATE
ncbi:MAG TPA: RNA polymerase sigma factor [Pirellulaceae bacterium]|nr:RNA polymerase sigma factor [Pirellulaceae bacterium]